MNSKRTLLIATLALVMAGCNVPSPFEHLTHARALAADLLVRFTQAADASNSAVMAETEDASSAFARDAEQAKAAVQSDLDALQQVLFERGYHPEADLLQQFASHFARYRELDREILALAAENTNRKARHLSFTQGQQQAEAFRKELESLQPRHDANRWQVKARTLEGIAAVREIQVLQAPHIAEADDAAMAQLEARMAAAEGLARNTLQALAPLISAQSRSSLAAASSALEGFIEVNREIVALSRRNTNVRSLALSLSDKARLRTEGEAALKALRSALAKRGLAGSR